MAFPEVTYERYVQLGGRLDLEDFDASRSAAHAAVRYVVGFNSPEGAEQEEACERAVCAAADADYLHGASGGVGECLSSVTVGSFSATEAAPDGTSGYERDMRRVIRRELSGTGLLFQGIG